CRARMCRFRATGVAATPRKASAPGNPSKKKPSCDRQPAERQSTADNDARDTPRAAPLFEPVIWQNSHRTTNSSTTPWQGRRMRRVITYGTYDLFHEGHRRLLERAKNLGDWLIVGVTTENYDEGRGKLNVRQPLMERIHQVQDSGLADEVIIEEYEGQKINDIQKHGIDVFAIGSDWLGKFDYLKDYCEVVYLDRTKGVSSTELRNEAGMLN